MKVLPAIIILGLLAMIGSAQAPTGIRGFVYDHNGNLAGSEKDTIVVVETNDAKYVGHYYETGTSYWITNDVYGLYPGHWAIQGKTIENGTAYWSRVYYHNWNWGELIDQDIHCTSTRREPINWTR